jgi:Glycosyltransferases involved in cell wall biogenesis
MISVIIPVYNAEKYLKKCLDSVLNQTFKDLEIIAVDDGSSDGSPAILDDYVKKDARVKVIHKENSGVSETRNIGLSAVTGEFIAFLDSDDYIEREMYENLYKKIQEDNSDIVFCQIKRDCNGKIITLREPNFKKLVDNPKDIKYFFYAYNADESKDVVTDVIFGSVWRSLFKTDIIRKFKLSFNPELKIGEDRIFTLDYLSYVDKVSFVDKFLYFYYVNPASAMGARYKNYLYENNKKFFEEQKRIIDKSEMNLIDKKLSLNRIKYTLCNAVVTNEVKYNESASSELKKIDKETFFKELLTLSVFKTMFQDGVKSKKIIYFALIKLNMWRAIIKISKAIKK